MLLVVDVGNTATSFGLFETLSKNPQPKRIWTLSTSEIKKGRLPSFGKKMNIVGGIVSSVVPAVDRPLDRALKASFGFSFPFVSGSTRSKVKIKYKKPKEVGADRIVNARAAMEYHKGPSIVIDFGTATTFDCVSAKGEYLGGVIAPGPVISAEALYERTAKLPQVTLDRPAKILGQNTLESIQAGLYHGYRGLVKEIVARLKQHLGGRPAVFATGGQAHWILKDLGVPVRSVPSLTLVGLYYLWKDIYTYAAENSKEA